MNLEIIEDTCLSRAWTRAFIRLLEPGSHEVSPFIMSLTGFEDGKPTENADLRDALDDTLDHSKQQLVHTVANTIFPQSLWERSDGDRHYLYQQYLEYLPDYVSMEGSKNGKGLYFSRLIAYGIVPKAKEGKLEEYLPVKKLKEGGNQLEFIISRCKKGSLRAKFQAALYDPVRDQHDGPYQLFPCLQHITFVPDFKTQTIALNAFYATQQLFVKAYGNWLGLSRLGAFVASETGLHFTRLTCFAGIEKMDIRPKSGDRLDRLRDLSLELAKCETILN